MIRCSCGHCIALVYLDVAEDLQVGESLNAESAGEGEIQIAVGVEIGPGGSWVHKARQEGSQLLEAVDAGTANGGIQQNLRGWPFATLCQRAFVRDEQITVAIVVYI